MFSYKLFTSNLKHRFMNLPIKFKIIVVFLIFLMAYFIVSTAVYSQIMNIERTKQLHLSTNQSIDLMKSNIESNIENINNISKLIISNSNVRNYLTTYNASTMCRRAAYETLTQLYVTFPFIDSIYVYHFDGSNVNASRYITYSFVDDIRDAPWYFDVQAHRGKYLININAGGTLVSNTGKNNVSMIRTVYDFNTLRPIGILVINISQDFFSPIIEETKSKYGTSFVLLDDANNPIIKKKGAAPFTLPKELNAYSNGAIETLEDVKYYVLYSDLPKYNWKVVSYTPINTSNRVLDTLSFILIFLVLSTIIVFLGASFFTATLVTAPINKLILAMEGVKKGKFKRVNVLTGNDEIGELKKTYNIMVEEIEKMITREVATEKQKRKFELSILNEQIKPHFLYNTLDSISYLALKNNNKEVFDAISALGQFYRCSLNKGNELITLESEITMIKNYLILQKLRYGILLSDNYQLEEDTLKISILKNTLQPLVENCIYHGIKPSGEPGNISISSRIIEDRLYITIEDDGVGMNEEQIRHIQSDYLGENRASFGLRGTIARLKIHYGIDDVYEVKSERYKGTKIILKLPIQEVAQ